MKRLSISLFLLLIAGLGFSQTQPQWIRHAAISPDGSQIAFTYKGDLFVVPATGGDARQLTFHEAHDYLAVWNQKGDSLAFASDRYGNFDIFVMPAAGGAAKRLTFHSNDEHPYSFSANGQRVVFGASRMDIAEHRQYPRSYLPELYEVSTTGGRVRQVFTTPAEYAQFSPDGKTLLYQDKKGGENEWRKHHTSSITRDIWAYDFETGKHRQITTFEGEERQPVFNSDGDSFFYLSEESGSFNVYQMNLDGTSKKQLTSFEMHPVRFLSRGRNRLCFTWDGALYTMAEGGSPQKVVGSIRSQAGKNKDEVITINGGVQEMDISPNGKEIAFVARGEVFVTSVDGSMTKRITNTPGREAFVEFTPDGASVVYSAERDGKWGIYQTKVVRNEEEPFLFASTLLEEMPLIESEVDNYLAKFSPDSSRVAYVADRRNIKVRNLESGEEVTLLSSEDLFTFRAGDKYFTWSPDSKWLLIGWSATLSNGEVLLMSADGTRRVNLTESGYYDSRPKWVNNGKQMLWFSNRNGLKSYATSGQTQDDVYSMFFTKEGWDKFRLDKEEFDLVKAIEEAKKERKKKQEEKKDDKKEKKDDKDKEEAKKDSLLTFDWENLDERIARLTIHSSDLGDAVLSKDGEKLYYLARFEKGMNLWVTELRTKETKMGITLNASGGALQWDDKMENLYLLSEGSISKIEPDKGKKEGIKIAGEMTLDADAERHYMFEHVWNRTKNIFYHSNFHGVDWDSLKVEYAKYVPHTGNGYDFAELLSEMLGELNVSHAGARYSKNINNGDATASLGVFWDYEYEDNGMLITEVIEDGPLDKAGLDIKADMIIEKIDGQLLSPDKDYSQYLNRKANKFTLLDIFDPEKGERKQITVKPISLGAEYNLLYDRWVEKNREEVEERSEGQLGYVHIPSMSDGPFRNIYEDMMGKYFTRKGVIVDTRFNGGGDLVADLAMFFTGEPFLTYATEDKVVGREPTSRWTKPTLAMFNEANYSDGHCFACGYTDLKIGKTVGMPTPGTCSFAGWERLPNGGVWGVVPVSAKDKSGDWLENNQTVPQFKVKNTPGIIDTGRDQQLEKAIEELLKDINK